ncbi:hypothetical protein BpOF4_06540 [Alkalihalophilus pseudofirmus OF4]|uniref:Polysaccharide pyruvyl transferase domain-containing protein n=1 Tax=Alkalihalophilus pseudofirmus (strain ATCC BAA-2126 / JCM 17055 / OF4) TaxID=398511 RepID=D3G091_ALKPO|nr:polysaccharide pyruvyl transferase family protein [Alkalihalophilus pseudofirmus]ADC49366.1 hypothetical protein BpOF4_06540 [Alkalihalophilus pseudofirmus OF4]
MNGKKIALHGSYYFHNFGDMLMLDMMNKWIKEHNTQNKVYLPFAKNDVTNTIGADGEGVNSLLKSDALIYGGGGYLGEPPSKKYLWGLRAAIRHTPPGNILKYRKKPYAIIGVGVGPLSNPITRKAFTNICSNASLLAVRDEESKNYLIDYGLDESKVIQTSDMVMQLSMDFIANNDIDKATKDLDDLDRPIKLGIHLGANPYPEKTELLKDEIINFAKKNRDVGLVLLRDGLGPHPQVAHDIKNELPEQTLLISYNNHWYFSAILGLIDYVVTTKLHVGITATALGKVAVSFYAHGKTPRFYKQIDALDRCMPLNSIRKGEAQELIQKCLFNLPNIYKRPTEIVNGAEKNKKLLFQFLDTLDG